MSWTNFDNGNGTMPNVGDPVTLYYNETCIAHCIWEGFDWQGDINNFPEKWQPYEYVSEI